MTDGDRNFTLFSPIGERNRASSKVEPKNFAPPQTPFPGAQDSQNLSSWRWSLPLPTNPVWWRAMHAISSYRGNRLRNTPTNSQTGPITIHCAAASMQCNNWQAYNNISAEYIRRGTGPVPGTHKNVLPEGNQLHTFVYQTFRSSAGPRFAVIRDERIVTNRLLSNRIRKVISNHDYCPRKVVATN